MRRVSSRRSAPKGNVLNSVVAYLETLESSEDNPYLSFRDGNQSALNPQAKRGLDLFEGKAGCVRCHSGELLSDGEYHALGVPDNASIFAEPLRHITFRRFFRTLGIGEFVTMRDDPGRYALTFDEGDRGKFRTPSLLEAGRTAPYMHSGVFDTLTEVVEFYNLGGGDSLNKDAALRPLGLTDAERDDLVSFLQSLASPDSGGDAPTCPPTSPGRLEITDERARGHDYSACRMGALSRACRACRVRLHILRIPAR